MELTAWEVGLIVALDNAALQAMAGQDPKKPPVLADEHGGVAMTENEALRTMFRSIAAKKAHLGPAEEAAA